MVDLELEHGAFGIGQLNDLAFDGIDCVWRIVFLSVGGRFAASGEHSDSQAAEKCAEQEGADF